MAEDPLQQLAHWLGQQRTARQIAQQVTVHAGTQTTVAIDHLLSCPLDGHDGWRISNKAAYLPKTQFGSQARFRLNSAKDGRTICAHDRASAEVTAALGYHVDTRPRMPVLITAIGLRTDTADSAWETYRTLAAVLVAKQYVHALAAKIGRGGHVDLDLGDPKLELLMKRIGFTAAPNIRGFKPAGIHMRQPPLGGQPPDG
jgi:hypothetical protein